MTSRVGFATRSKARLVHDLGAFLPNPFSKVFVQRRAVTDGFHRGRKRFPSVPMDQVQRVFKEFVFLLIGEFLKGRQVRFESI